MKRYEKYKPSGIEWIGEIPEHWEIRKLKYLLSAINEKMEDDPNLKVSLENIESNTGRLLSSDNGNHLQGELRKFLKGDILFNKLRPYLAKAYLADDNGGCAGELLILRCKTELIPKFLFYRILSEDFIRIVDSSTYGSKMPRASWEDSISQLSIPYPRQGEQAAVAAFLDKKTAEIDALIAKKRHLIDLLNQEKAAIINQAVTKGLDHEGPMKDSGVPWIGQIPAHWQVCKLKYLLEVKDGTHDTPEYVMPSASSFPLVTSKDIKDGEIDFSDAKHISEDDHMKANQRSDVVFGDVIMPMIGTVGGAAVVKSERRFSIKNVALFKTSSQSLYAQYFCHLIDSRFASSQFDLLSRGGVQGFVSLDVLRNLLVFKLSDQEQIAIARHIEYLSEKIDSSASKIQTEIKLLQEYRTALISEAVTGKIDVRGAN